MKKRTFFLQLLFIFILCPTFSGLAAEETVEETVEVVAPAMPSSTALVSQAWEAANKKEFDKLEQIVSTAQEAYGFEAQQLHYELDDFPGRDRVNNYKILNDLATILFVQAESLMHRGEGEKAIDAFQSIIDQYPWAQSWDPSRGQYWSIAEKSQISIEVIQGVRSTAKTSKKRPQGPVTTVAFQHPGEKQFINYKDYGEFKNVGTADYVYEIHDREGLIKAVGEGIFPTGTHTVLKSEGYIEALRQGRLEGSHWDFIQTEDLEAAYYKWLLAPEPWGVRLFYLGGIYEKAGLWAEAVKAYYALVVHFPETVAMTYWQTPWYPAQAAVGKIKHILREHPELKLRYRWGKIQVKNSLDNNTDNDEFITYPGIIEPVGMIDQAKTKLGMSALKEKLGEPKRRLGNGRVQLVQYENDHWQMLVDGKPFFIQGMTYVATKVGQGPDQGTLANWMKEDTNDNGLPDGPYDAWVDENENGEQDDNEPTVGDFRLMKEMGVNAIRLYHHPDKPVKRVLRDMYNKYGIMVIMGDFLGKYTHGSGASWFEGTDYENEVHQKAMMDSVREMVLEHKDEPYLLMWALGNENNYGVASNGDTKPEAYFKFANEVSKMIKEMDPNHPVSLVNGDTLFLDVYAQYAQDIDIFSSNVYRGDYGFGSFWDQVKEATDKPAFIKEYGAPAYGHHMTLQEAEEKQAAYHRGNWYDILENSAGYTEGAGNSLGGVVFQWMDEWWKNYEPAFHDTETEVIGPFPGGYYFEEWFGIISQGDGTHSPFLRQPREAYYTYKELWN